MSITLEKTIEKYRKPVIDILNYYVLNSTSTYREEMVGYQHFDNFMESSDVLSSYVVLENANVVGFCTLELYKTISTFQKLGDVMYFLLPEATGKGIGKKILKKLETDAIEKCLTKIVVDISDDNERSIEFHQKNGFCEYGRLRNCWEKHGKKLGIVFMEKDLMDVKKEEKK